MSLLLHFCDCLKFVFLFALVLSQLFLEFFFFFKEDFPNLDASADRYGTSQGAKQQQPRLPTRYALAIWSSSRARRIQLRGENRQVKILVSKTQKAFHPGTGSLSWFSIS